MDCSTVQGLRQEIVRLNKWIRLLEQRNETNLERLQRKNERLLDALELIAENGSGGPELDWVEFASEVVHAIKYRKEETWEQST